MKTGIERIAVKARENKKCRFNSLAHHINKDLIRSHLKSIPTKSAVGVDNETRNETLANFDNNILPVISAIHNMGYKAPPVRRIYIPKPGKAEKRPIGIPTILDRSVQGAVAEVLNAIYEQDFLGCSFGGRPKRGAHNAVATFVTTTFMGKANWVYEADIKNFFGSLDHAWMIKFLEHRVGDLRVLKLLRQWLKAGVLENDVVHSTDMGTPQGGPISVLLSNIYMHYVLDLWFEKIVKPRLKGNAFLIRYIDDFIVLFQHRSDALLFQSAIQDRLGKFALQLEPSKTHLIRFGRFSRQRAKERGEKQEVVTFLGFTMFPSKGKSGQFVVAMRTSGKRLNLFIQRLKMRIRKNMHLPLAIQSKKLFAMINGHFNYYGVWGNSHALRKVLDECTRYWKKYLSHRSQNGSVDWQKMHHILKIFPLPAAKIRISSSKMSSLAMP